ncbi:MAG TPA: hypothetical protein VMF69_02125, partial [Gemmataceae bacterium]|nr:hypothetical protein [Gemmataceae bacterium]
MPDKSKRFSSIFNLLYYSPGFWTLVGALLMLLIGLHRRVNLLLLLGDALMVVLLLNLLAAGRSLRGLQVRRRLDEWLFARTPFGV